MKLASFFPADVWSYLYNLQWTTYCMIWTSATVQNTMSLRSPWETHFYCWLVTQFSNKKYREVLISVLIDWCDWQLSIFCATAPSSKRERAKVANFQQFPSPLLRRDRECFRATVSRRFRRQGSLLLPKASVFRFTTTPLSIQPNCQCISILIFSRFCIYKHGFLKCLPRDCA